MDKIENFDDFWKKHSEDYISHAKNLAFQDFNELSKIRLGKLVATISIYTDDDFFFENKRRDHYSYQVYGNNKKEILKNSINFIKSLKITDGSQEKWNWLRKDCIDKLHEGETDFTWGGNQTLEFNVSENTPRVKLKNGI